MLCEQEHLSNTGRNGLTSSGTTDQCGGWTRGELDDPRVIVGWLIESRALAAVDCFSDEFAIERVVSRNRVHVVRGRSRTVVVKQCASVELCADEASHLRAIPASSIALNVPRVELVEGSILVTSTPRLAPMASGHRRGLIGRGIIDQLAIGIAALHGASEPQDGEPGHALTFDPFVAGIETVNDSLAVRQVLRRLQRDESVRLSMRSLRASLRLEPPSWTHGDLRAANVLFDTDRSVAWVIDWEVAGFGRSSVDLGALVAMILEQSIHAPTTGADATGTRRLLRRYSATGRAVLLESVVRCAGVRFLQSAAEQAAGESECGPYTNRLIAIGTMLLTRPEESAVRLGLLG